MAEQNVTQGPPESRVERNRSRRSWLWIALVVALFALVGGVVWSLTDGEPASASGDYNPDTMAAKSDNQKVVRDLLVELGWKPEQLNFGALTERTEDRGVASFSAKSILSEDELVSFLTAPTKQSKAVRRNLRAYLNAQGYGDKEFRRMMTGNGWVRVQFLDAFQWNGMTYYASGRMVVSYSPRKVMSGDVGWFYVATDGKALKGRTVVRGDCGNPAPAPKPAPPGFKPPTKPQPTPTPLEPKDSSEFPDEPKPDSAPTDNGGGSDDNNIPARPAPDDPTPDGTTDVNPPAEPENPDSGEGATDTVTPPPDSPPPEDAAPPPPDDGDVGGDPGSF